MRRVDVRLSRCRFQGIALNPDVHRKIRAGHPNVAWAPPAKDAHPPEPPEPLAPPAPLATRATPALPESMESLEPPVPQVPSVWPAPRVVQVVQAGPFVSLRV